MDTEKRNIYIDESGIHRTTKYSSFVLVYIAVRDEDQLRSSIQQIEKDLKIDNFHWADFGSRSGWKIRTKFIQRCAVLPFYFKYIVVNNPISSAQELYNSLATLLIEKDIGKVLIDGKQPKWYERQIKKFLRDRGVSVKQLKTINDLSEPIIRLADALAGLVRLYHDNPEGAAKELFEYIKRNHLQ